MKTTTLAYPSYDGTSTVRALLWQPDGTDVSARPRGLVQLVHGMSEHVERYAPFAEFLCNNGFSVCANDHIGHGKTAAPCDLGHMPIDRGKESLLHDVNSLREIAIRRIACEAGVEPKGIPYFIFGHSMGSFITRVYLTRYALGVRGAVICGTGHQPRALSAAGSMMTRILARSRGERYVSDFVDALGAGAYGKQVEGATCELDWLSTDSENVAAYIADPLCGQRFTVGAYHALTSMVGDATDPKVASRIPHGLPMFFIAGDQDPVGECGAAVKRAARMYEAIGIEDVRIRLYPGMRHEILNEPVKDQVHDDVLAWLEDCLG